MPATPQINYFDSRQGYYTQYTKRQRLLAKGPKDEPDGPTYRAAVKKFSEIIHVADADQAGNENLVITVIDRYAVHLKNQGRERSLDMFRRCCNSAVQEFGHLKYKDRKILHIQEWLDKMGLERGRSRGHDVVRPSEGNEVRPEGRQGVGALHSIGEAGEPDPRDPVEKRGCRIGEPLEGNRAGALEPGPLSTQQQRIAEQGG